jgi:hypothetical protein
MVRSPSGLRRGRVPRQLHGAAWSPSEARFSRSLHSAPIGEPQRQVLGAVPRVRLQHQHESPARIAEPPLSVGGNGVVTDRRRQDATEPGATLGEHRVRSNVHACVRVFVPLIRDEEGGRTAAPRAGPGASEIGHGPRGRGGQRRRRRRAPPEKQGHPECRERRADGRLSCPASAGLGERSGGRACRWRAPPPWPGSARGGRASWGPSPRSSAPCRGTSRRRYARPRGSP